MDVPFQGKVRWGEEQVLGRHLPVPLFFLSPALFPQAVGANKGTKLPQAPATESLGGALEPLGIPDSYLCIFAQAVPCAVFIFLSHSLSQLLQEAFLDY